MDRERWYERHYPNIETPAACVITYVIAAAANVGLVSAAIALVVNGVVLGRLAVTCPTAAAPTSST